jgi:D-alanyl-lipoteichoic acid acyltransferase DltB (MBOAT superfamily)
MQAITAPSKSSKCSDNFMHTLRQQDVFGKRVQFTYKGRSTYKTTIGAMVTILLGTIMAFFFVYEFYVIFSYKHPKVSVKVQLSDFVTNPDTWSEKAAMDPWELGFDIAFAL